MTISILLVDPDIKSALRIKQALETSGDFAVSAFASANAALEALQRDPQDVAIVDFDTQGMPLEELIAALRIIQPSLYILVSPRTNAQGAQIANLDVQGSITRPYFARQLIPVIREAAAAKARFDYQTRYGKRKKAHIPDAPLMPDDTFRRLSEQTPRREAGTDTGVGLAVRPPGDESAASEDATLGEVVTGNTPAHSEPPSLPEMPASPPPAIEPKSMEDSAVVASVVLETASDTSTPLSQVSVQSVVDQVNIEIGATQGTGSTKALPAWSAEPPSAEPTPAVPESVAQLAVQLTQLTVDLAASTTLLTLGDTILGHAGELPDNLLPDVLRVINGLWTREQEAVAADPQASSGALIRVINVPDAGDYMLFSTFTVENMLLSMLFGAETSIRIIRKQARQLLDVLEKVPESAEPPPPASAAPGVAIAMAEPPAPMPQPAMVVEAVAVEPVAPVAAAAPVVETAPVTELVPPALPPSASYAVMWSARQSVPAAWISTLPQMLVEIGQQRGWNVHSTAIMDTIVMVELNLPANVLPSTAAEGLMAESAARLSDPWADSFYIAMQPGPIPPQDIAEFLEFQRDAARM